MATLIAQYNSSQPYAGYYLRTDVYLDSQDIATNKSYGHTDVLAVAGGGKFDSDSTSWAVQTDGEGASGSRSANFSGGSFWLVTGAGWNADHNPDGTKQISSSVQWNGAPGGWFASGFSGSSGTITLPTIPRASTAAFTPASPIRAGAANAINITRASSSFTHVVELLTNADVLVRQLASAAATLVNWTPTIQEIFASNPSLFSVPMKIKISTYNGATLIGTNTYAISVTRTGLRVHNGAAWIAKPIRAYDGSAWVQASVRVHDGSAFIPTTTNA